MLRLPEKINTPIRAMFLDIDGTLVSFRTHAVSPTVCEAISKVRRLGVKVIIATGRPLPFVDNLTGLEYDGIMTVNGACCQTSDGTVIRHNPICRDDLNRMIDYCSRRPIPMAFTSTETAYSNFITDEFIQVFNLLNIKLPQQRPLDACLDMDVVQLVAFFSQTEEQQLMHDVFPHCIAHRWHNAFADVISLGNSKQDGVDAFCHYYGIPLSWTMAFGDGGNDIGMLCHVGYGFAMANAKQEVLDQAPFVTYSVDDDGVAKTLNKLLDLR